MKSTNNYPGSNDDVTGPNDLLFDDDQVTRLLRDLRVFDEEYYGDITFYRFLVQWMEMNIREFFPRSVTGNKLETLPRVAVRIPEPGVYSLLLRVPPQSEDIVLYF
ncbi:hypothetical protein ACLOJK_000928 [Asimina triloba]